MLTQLHPDYISCILYGALHRPSLAQIEQTYPNTPIWGIEEGFDLVLGGMVEAINKAIRETGKQPW